MELEIKPIVITIAISTVLLALFLAVLFTGPRRAYTMDVNGTICNGMYYNRETASNKRYSTTRTDVECDDGTVFVNVTNLRILGQHKIPGILWGK